MLWVKLAIIWSTLLTVTLALAISSQWYSPLKTVAAILIFIDIITGAIFLMYHVKQDEQPSQIHQTVVLHEEV